MKKSLEIGGLIAAVLMVAFGIGAIVMGFDGRSTVSDSLKQEYVTGSPDMAPAATKSAIKDAGLAGQVSVPTCDVANKPIDNGDSARCFAEYMRIHTLESTGGYTYAQMGRFEAAPGTPKSELAEGGGTSNEKYAATDPKTGAPVANHARDLWVTETAITTALNSSYMADRLSLFGIVVGIALLLSGIGFAVLVASGAVRDPDTVLRFLHVRKTKNQGSGHAVAHS